MNKIIFLLGIHNHQPVGNFESVLDYAYEKSYKPFIDLLFQYPEIKFSLHCSGILWDYFMSKHKEYIEIVKEMVSRGQLELISGGYYEPILSSIPQNDRIGQIKMMNDFLNRQFGVEPKGLWLTERVWEQSVVKDIVDSGLQYTLVDDYHFFSAGLPKQELTGYYVTDEEGRVLYVFPISQTLRYYIPFKPVNEVIQLFKKIFDEHKQQIVSLTMGDDGEKFGLWPKTHEHVYKNGWLKNFLEKIKENSNWLSTVTFSEFLQLQPPKGRIYLPTSSYFEMGEWTLPQPTQELFEEIIKNLDSIPKKEIISQFLRGGYWKNFFAKYDESNNMHKKMLYVSQKVHKAKIGSSANNKLTGLPDEIINLYKSQCNCAYWHGIFGGLYLPHLRNAIYEHLIKAEKSLYKKDKIELIDFDKDGRIEVVLENKNFVVHLKPSYGGCATEIDLKNYDHNLCSVLTRRREAYHKRLIEFEKNNMANHIDPSKIKTIHDLVLTKEPNLSQYLFYDWYTRYSFLDHFLHKDTKYENFYKSQYGEQGNFTIEPYNLDKVDKKNFCVTFSRRGIVWVDSSAIEINIQKSFYISDKIRCEYNIENLSNFKVDLWFLTELNFMLPRPSQDLIGELVTDRWFSSWYDSFNNKKFDVIISVPQKTIFWIFPIETISLSEGGFERTYQGVCIAVSFKFSITHKEKFFTKVELEIK